MISPSTPQRQQIFFAVDGFDLHLERISGDLQGPVVVFLHGSIENGRVFYSQDLKKGLAPFFATHGFDCYVADLRGRGESRPRINRETNYGQTESIRIDIPAIANKIRELRPGQKQNWICHSYGGVWLSSYLAYEKNFAQDLSSLVFLGTKRVISALNFSRFIAIDIIFNRIGPLLAQRKGYLDSKLLGVGSDNETLKAYRQCRDWIRPGDTWKDDDGFNYADHIQQVKLPPIFSLAAISDKYLGHPKDCRAFLDEIKTTDFEFEILAKRTGAKENYDHISLLTSRNAATDHFPRILHWVSSKASVRS